MTRTAVASSVYIHIRLLHSLEYEKCGDELRNVSQGPSLEFIAESLTFGGFEGFACLGDSTQEKRTLTSKFEPRVYLGSFYPRCPPMWLCASCARTASYFDVDLYELNLILCHVGVSR